LAAGKRTVAKGLRTSGIRERLFTLNPTSQFCRHEGDEVSKIKKGNNRSSAKLFTTFSILESLPKKIPGCCSLGGIIITFNITIAGERGVLTPTLTGAQPAL
jgi:hypothetical protein